MCYKIKNNCTQLLYLIQPVMEDPSILVVYAVPYIYTDCITQVISKDTQFILHKKIKSYEWLFLVICILLSITTRNQRYFINFIKRIVINTIIFNI